MADATYQPKVYRKQGGAEQIIASGGTQTVESGGAITVDSGATLTVNGTLALGTGATVTLPVVAESEGSTMANSGISTIGGTSAHTWFLAPPVAGAYKIICVTAASTSSGGAQTIDTGSSLITFDGTDKDELVCEGVQGVVLVGLSTTRWFIASQALAIASSSEFAQST